MLKKVSDLPTIGGKSEHKHIHLQKNERTELEQLTKSGTHSARNFARARIILLLERSLGQERKIREVVDAAMVSQGTVSNVKKRYFADGLDGALFDKLRPGAKPKIDGEVEAHLISLACSDPPEGYAC
ncbi:MAG: helix-turn-helix domain-containing protein [Anaerolineaceae bacterium]|nr:MAG: helix-turn-helix domain-containing protein [Anaerolineaceae bacterium]